MRNESIKDHELTLISNRGKVIQLKIDKPEIIGGSIALLFNGKPEEGEFVKNPLTDEKMFLIPRTETRLFIPAHIQEDYDFAMEREIPIKQVIAPYFFGSGEETVRKDVETQKRHSVIAIIKHNERDEYLCLDCKGRNCKSFVLGGIEQGENAEEAARREVLEETGYRNITIERKSAFKLINHFYAGYKGVNRYATLEVVFGSLKNDEYVQISEEESKKHIVKWINRKDLVNFININNNKYALDLLLYGEKAWTGDGVMINSGELNGIPAKEAGEKILEILNKNKTESKR